MMSFAVIPFPSLVPRTRMCKVGGTLSHNLPSARTAAISVGPMPRGYRTHGPEHVGVRIGTYGKVARDHPAILGEDLVADPVVPNVIEVSEVLLCGEFAQDAVEHGGALRGGGDPVVDGDDDAAP